MVDDFKDFTDAAAALAFLHSIVPSNEAQDMSAAAATFRDLSPSDERWGRAGLALITLAQTPLGKDPVVQAAAQVFEELADEASQGNCMGPDDTLSRPEVVRRLKGGMSEGRRA